MTVERDEQEANVGPDARPVARDHEHFRLLAHDPPAVIPDGFIAPLDCRTTREIINERAKVLEGYIMSPQPYWEEQAASIICGHDFVQRMSDDDAALFKAFMLIRFSPMTARKSRNSKTRYRYE